MSLSVALSQPTTHSEQIVRFSRGNTVVVIPDTVKKTKKKEADIDVLRVILDHEKTASALRGCCYRKIWELLSHNPCLRNAVTTHHSAILLDDVIDNAGYGIVVMRTAEPAVGKHVGFTYYPRIDGVLRREYSTSVQTCPLGTVLNVNMV